MKRIAVLTSGGDAPGMNAGLRAVVRTAIYNGLEVFGVERGYQGMIDDQIHAMGARDVSGIINRGGTILRSARCQDFRTFEGRAKAAENLNKRGIEGIVVIGGDGSYRGAQDIASEYDFKVMGMPGTIDNDIGGTDYTIGFDTAMNIAMEAIDRIRDTAASHDRVFLVEVMGRASGYIAVVAGIAGGAEEILVPERKTQVEALARNLLEGRENGKTSMIVVVAEGDDAGNAFDIAAKLKEATDGAVSAKVTVLGHLQRGGSPTAFDRVLASRMGVAAVEGLLQGHSGKMVGISNNHMMLRPLTEAWECPQQFDMNLLRVARVLSV